MKRPTTSSSTRRPIHILKEIIHLGASVAMASDQLSAKVIKKDTIRLTGDGGRVFDIDPETLFIAPDGLWSYRDKSGHSVWFSVVENPCDDYGGLQDMITHCLHAIAKKERFAGVKKALRMAVANFVVEFKNKKTKNLLDPNPALLEELAEAIQTPVYLQS